MTTNLCKYENKDVYPEYVCGRQAESDDYCIFHIDKPFKNPRVAVSEAERIEAFHYSARFFNEIKSYMATVTGDTYDFRGFVFPNIIWKSPNFDKNVSFQDAKFPQGFTFYPDLVFEGNARFNNTVFYLVHFNSGMTFKGFVFFKDSTFYDSHISGGFFEQSLTFIDTTFFGRKINLRPEKVKGDVRFSNVRFEDENELIIDLAKPVNDPDLELIEAPPPAVKFYGTSFEGKCAFNKTDFFVEANFRTIKFKERTTFFGTTFHQEADFTNIEVDKNLSFIRSTFAEKAIFNEAKLKGDITFNGNDNRCFKKEAYFQKMDLPKDVNLSFDKTNLSQASFLYTNLELINFLDVDWFKSKAESKWLFFLPSRPQLWDEKQLESSSSLYERVADNYRQLVNNYEKKRNFETAESFHIGEMETRRRKHKHNSSIGINNKWWRWFRGRLNATAFYELSSRYGTSYTQAIIVLLILAFIIVPSMFLLTGFKVIEGQRQIGYTLIPSSTNQIASIPNLLNDFGSALSYTFSIITFQKDRFYEPINLMSQFALYFALFTLTTQAAFVLLAIRRQFKR